ncbi:MAG: transcriptional repressor [Spirochaetales bacterium]|nr:transcriptional repressor [Spirochaetales bacterium]
MKVMRRNSKQRNRIYELIKSNYRHPTAQWIYDQLRKEFSSMSMGNVYRNINILIEEGLIITQDFGDGIVHYDAVIVPHYHFICKKCNAITDFSLPVQDTITKLAQKETKNIISGHTIQFFGTCEKCTSNKG